MLNKPLSKLKIPLLQQIKNNKANQPTNQTIEKQETEGTYRPQCNRDLCDGSILSLILIDQIMRAFVLKSGTRQVPNAVKVDLQWHRHKTRIKLAQIDIQADGME